MDSTDEAVLKISADVESAVSGLAQLVKGQEDVVKAANDIQVKFGNMAGVADSFLAGVLDGVKSGATEFAKAQLNVQSFNKELEDTGKVLKEAQPLAEGFLGTMHLLPPILQKAIGGLAAMRLAVRELKEPIDQLAEHTFGAAENFGQFANALRRTTVQLGVSAEFYQSLSVQLERLGLGSDAARSSLLFFSRAIENARQGAGPAADAIQALNIDISAGRGQDAIYLDLARAITGLEGITKRTAVAFTFFGRQGATQLPVLAAMAQLTTANTEELHALGVVLGTDVVSAGIRFDTAMTEVHEVLRAGRNEWGLLMSQALLPFVEFGHTGLAKVALTFHALHDAMLEVVKVGVVLASAVISMTAAWVLSTAAMWLATKGWAAITFAISLATGALDQWVIVSAIASGGLTLILGLIGGAAAAWVVYGRAAQHAAADTEAAVDDANEALTALIATLDKTTLHFGLAADAISAHAGLLFKYTKEQQKQIDAALTGVEKAVDAAAVAEETRTKGRLAGLKLRGDLDVQELEAERDREIDRVKGLLNSKGKEAAIRQEYAYKIEAARKQSATEIRQSTFDEGNALTQIQIDAQRKAELSTVALREEASRKRLAQHEITEQQLTASLRVFEEERYRIELKYAEQESRLPATVADPARHETALAKVRDIRARHLEAMSKLDTQEVGQAEKTQRELATIAIDGEKGRADTALSIAEEGIKQRRELNQITGLEALRATQSLHDQQLLVERDALEKKLALLTAAGGAEKDQAARLNAQILEIEQQRLVNASANATEILKATRAAQINLTTLLSQGLDDAFSGILLGTRKLSDVLTGFEQSLVKQFSSAFTKALLEKAHFDKTFSLNMTETLPAAAGEGAGLVGKTWSSLFSLLSGGTGVGADVSIDDNGFASWVNGSPVAGAASGGVGAGTVLAGYGTGGLGGGIGGLVTSGGGFAASPARRLAGGGGVGGIASLIGTGVTTIAGGFAVQQASKGNFLPLAVLSGGLGAIASFGGAGLQGLVGLPALSSLTGLSLGTAAVPALTGAGAGSALVPGAAEASAGIAGGAGTLGGVLGIVGILALIAQGIVAATGEGHTTFKAGAGTAIGLGSGALAGGTAGFAIGGPIGLVVGAVVGAIVGAIAGSLGSSGVNVEKAIQKHGIRPLYEKAGLAQSTILSTGNYFGYKDILGRDPQDIFDRSLNTPQGKQLFPGGTIESMAGDPALEQFRKPAAALAAIYSKGNAQFITQFTNTFVDNARILNQSVDQTKEDLLVLAKTMGVDVTGSLHSLGLEFREGTITQQQYNEGVVALIELFNDLPKGISAATIATQSMGADGVVSLVKYAAAMEDVATASRIAATAITAAATAALPTDAAIKAAHEDQESRDRADKDARTAYTQTQIQQKGQLEFLDFQIAQSKLLGDTVRTSRLEMERSALLAAQGVSSKNEAQRQKDVAQANKEALAAIDPEATFMRTLKENLKASVLKALTDAFVQNAIITGAIEPLLNLVREYSAKVAGGKPEGKTEEDWQAELKFDRDRIKNQAAQVGRDARGLWDAIGPTLVEAGQTAYQSLDWAFAPPDVRALGHTIGYDEPGAPGYEGAPVFDGPGPTTGTLPPRTPRRPPPVVEGQVVPESVYPGYPWDRGKHIQGDFWQGTDGHWYGINSKNQVVLLDKKPSQPSNGPHGEHHPDTGTESVIQYARKGGSGEHEPGSMWLDKKKRQYYQMLADGSVVPATTDEYNAWLDSLWAASSHPDVPVDVPVSVPPPPHDQSPPPERDWAKEAAWTQATIDRMNREYELGRQGLPGSGPGGPGWWRDPFGVDHFEATDPQGKWLKDNNIGPRTGGFKLPFKLPRILATLFDAMGTQGISEGGEGHFPDPNIVDYTPVTDPIIDALPTRLPEAVRHGWGTRLPHNLQLTNERIRHFPRSSGDGAGGSAASGEGGQVHLNLTITGNYIIDTQSARRLGHVTANAMMERLKHNHRVG